MLGRKVTYIVLSHNPPDQVDRLVRAILRSSRTGSVLVAHDARHHPPLETDDPRVDVWRHGMSTDWGSWALVEASVRAFQRALERHDPEWLALISGSDYPTRRLDIWEKDLLAHQRGWVGAGAPLTYSPRWGKEYGVGNDDLTRYTYRWFEVPRVMVRIFRAGGLFGRVRRGIFHRIEPALAVRYVDRADGRVLLGVRRGRNPFDGEHPCVKGSQWIALDRWSARYLCDSLKDGAPWRRVYERTVIPDESCLQSLLTWHSPRLTDIPPVSAVSVYPDGTAVPLTAESLPSILASASPFWRKVDPEASAPLLDRLDDIALSR